MTTPDIDPDLDGVPVSEEGEVDLTDLQTAPCASCCGTGVVRDPEIGSSVTCPRCAGAPLDASGRAGGDARSAGTGGRPGADPVTLRISRVAPAQIWAIVQAELDAVGSLDSARLSPIASLALLVSEYLACDRALRLAEIRRLSSRGCPEHDRLMGDLVRAEVALRRAISLPGDSFLGPGRALGADLVEGDPEVGVAILPRVLDLVEDARMPATGGPLRRFLGWLRQAVGRLRGGWEPR